MAELQFFTGTMDSGKSTLALQTNHNRAARVVRRHVAGKVLVHARHGSRRVGQGL